MHRIDTEGHSSNLFQDSTVPKTVVNDDWLNAVQEEIANAVEDCPAAPALVKGTNTQLRDAVKSYVGVIAFTNVTAGYSGEWSSYTAGGNNEAGYYKEPSGWVNLRGAVIDSTATNGTIHTSFLPAGCRPAATFVACAPMITGATWAMVAIEIDSNGQLRHLGGAALTSGSNRIVLDGLRFFAEV